jgi:hypothetical protein
MRHVNLRSGRGLSRHSVFTAVVALFLTGAWLDAQATQPAAPKPAPAPPRQAPAPPPKPDASRDLPAQQADQERALPSARTIIDRYVEAIGGRKAILAHSSSHLSGTMTVTGSGITGVLDIYGAKPDKSLVKINLGGIGDLFEGFDGINAWSISPMTGPMLTQGKELDEKKFDADFYSDLHDPARYTSMKTVEKMTFEGRPCYKVSLVKKDGGEDIEFFDVATGLKAGAMVTRESQMGPISATQALSDYKKFGELLLPTTMKQSQMGMDQVVKVTSIEFDNVAPSTFDPPAQIKALIK